MIESFNQELTDWQPFFTTLAAVCATLAGLLFVALSIHASTLAASDKINLRRLAEHTFSDFILVLVIALFFLAPHFDRYSIGAELLALGIVGVAHFARTLYLAVRERKSEHRGYLLRRLRLSLLAYLAIVGCGASMLEAVSLKQFNYWPVIFAAVLGLLLSATRNAWFLLVHEFV